MQQRNKNIYTLIFTFICFMAYEKLYAQTEEVLPFKKIKPVSPAFQPLPLNEVTPGGWIREELRKNLDGFTGHLDSLVPDLILNDDIYGKNRLTKKIKNKNVGAVSDAGDWQVQFLWWNSETQSNWLDGYIRTAVLLNDKKQLSKEAQIINRF